MQSKGSFMSECTCHVRVALPSFSGKLFSLANKNSRCGVTAYETVKKSVGPKTCSVLKHGR